MDREGRAGEDTVLTKGEWPEWSSSDKGPRRDWVASRYRVLLVLFSAAGKSLAERNELVHDNAGKFGSSSFILPNPIYGWHLYRKIEALEP